MRFFVLSILLPFFDMFYDDGGAGGAGGDQGGEDPLVGLTEDQKKIIEDQRKKAIEDAVKQRFKKYEGLDADEYKRLKEAEDKRKESEKTDLDKEREARQKAEDDAKRSKLSAERTLKLADIKVIASELQINPVLVSKLVDLEAITVKEDGTVEGTKAALEALAKEYPELKKQQTGGGSFGAEAGRRAGGNGNETDEEWGKKMAEERSKQSTVQNAFDPWK
jgi:hypothetical protein